MTHLNIQLGQNIEVVSADVIKKLYEAALSVSEPLSGELDTAYMSGNLLVGNTYRSHVEYLTARFNDLHINVTGDYYISFADNVLGNKLILLYSSDGIGVTETDAANAVITLGDIVDIKNSITSFDEFNKFTKANGDFGNSNSRFRDFVNMTSINLTALTCLRGSDFRNTAITTVNAPNLATIGSLNGVSAFLSCTSLVTVESLGAITIIPQDCFRECTSLTTVNIPNTVTLLDTRAFLSSGVTHINYDSTTNTNDLSGITNIKASAFRYCSNLSEKLYAPDVLEVGETAFQNCTGLIGDLSLPSLTSLGKSSFAGCTGITSVSNLGNISEIKTTNGGYLWGAFRDCTNLTEITWPTTLTSFDFDIFGANTNVQKFIFPYGMTAVNRHMPENAISKKVKYIQFPSTITHINCIEMNYYTLQNQVDMYIVVQATNIPTTGYTSNGNSYKGTYVGYPEYSKWYVPDAKLNDYKAHADWAPFASSIYPISQLETDSPTWWAVYLANKDYGVPTS